MITNSALISPKAWIFNVKYLPFKNYKDSVKIKQISSPAHVVLGGLAAVLGFLQLLLGFPELGQVEGGDLLRVLDLLLVRPRLALQLLHQLAQLLKVLLVLLAGELQLLDRPIGPDRRLVSLAAPHLRGPELVLEHPHLLFQLGDHLPAIAGRGGLHFLEPHLQLVVNFLIAIILISSTVPIIITIIRKSSPAARCTAQNSRAPHVLQPLRARARSSTPQPT